MLYASSRTNTFTSDTSMTRRRMRSVIVPGVPTTICAVMLDTPLGKWSLIAYSVCTGVNLPIAAMTDMIWRANSREGARHRACGLFFVKSTRESIVRTNAAVLPVPDCDWPIIFCGLQLCKEVRQEVVCPLTDLSGVEEERSLESS